MSKGKEKLLKNIKAYLRENDLNKMGDFLNEMSNVDQYSWLIKYTEIFGSYNTPTKDQVNQVVEHIEDENFNSIGLASNIRLKSLGNITLNPSSEPFNFMLGTAEEHLNPANLQKAKFYYHQAQAIKESYNRKDVIIRLVDSFISSYKNDTDDDSFSSGRGQHFKENKIRPEDKFWEEASIIYQDHKKKCLTKNKTVTNFLVNALFQKKFMGYKSNKADKEFPLTKSTIRRRLNKKLEEEGSLIDSDKHK